jgi:hypothetical protein
MLRIYLGMFHLLGVVLLKFFFLGGDVTTTIDVPAQINAGKEMKVQITINKGDLQGFSRFQMELPAGITATNVSSANADFSFKDQKIRLIWLRLPEEPTITIAFNIHCYEQLKGNFELQGKFSYIDNNEQKNINIQPQAIAIVPSPAIAPNLLVDISDFGKVALPQPGSSEGQVACIRQKPAWSELNKEYEVTLLVNKESLKKFAKIEEIIPAGYTAVNIDNKEGIFTFKDNKIKFLWMNLGAAPYFTVRYKLIPNKTAPVGQSPSISGTFSYMIEDKTRSIAIIEKDVSLANLTPEMVKNIMQEPVYLASNVSSSQTSAMQEKNTRNVQKGKDVKQSETKVTDMAQNVNAGKGDKTPAQNIPGSSDTETIDLLEPQTGVYYRVQLAAGHRPINIKSYFRKYKLENRVFKENHNGWIKYSVGSFNVYKDAHDYRVHIWNTTPIADAFVAAYNGGKRITVQEALMVANQKWYK